MKMGNRVAAGVLATLSGRAGSRYHVSPAHKAVLPQNAEARAPGKRRIAPDGVVAQTPAVYEPISTQSMDGESAAKILCRGKTGLIGGHVSLDFQVTEAGRPLMFNNVRTQVSISKLPQHVEPMGAAFTVQSYDPADGSVVIDMERGFPEADTASTPPTRRGASRSTCRADVRRAGIGLRAGPGWTN